jgi:hypothetical protein
MRRNLSYLKLLHLIPPVVALALVVAWNTAERRAVSSLETESAVLRGKISKALASGSSRTALTAAATNGKTQGASKRPINWKEMAALVAAAQDGGDKAGMRALLDFQQRLSEMSREEMIAALDEIAALGLSDAERLAMEEMIVEALLKQDPQYVLERFVDRIESEPDGIGWQLSTAMGEWAKKDLKAATAWFDRQIAAGKFESRSLDGRSEMRTQFEAALMESMIGSDPASAAARLAELPEDQRREVLQQLPFSDLSPEEQKAYAAMVRELIPEDERAGSFAHIASQLVDDEGYGKVGAFLDAIGATPEERAAAAKQTAESRLSLLANEDGVTRADVDSLREWLTRQAPGETDSIIGKALAEAAQDSDAFGFSEASQLALHYQKISGSDDVLVAFLKSYSARSNLEEARHLADMITDEKLRKQLLRDLK